MTRRSNRQDVSYRARSTPRELPGVFGPGWRFFQTVAGPDDTAYPTEISAPTVYYAKQLKDVSFTETVGTQTLGSTATDTYKYLFNLSTDDYIEEDSVVLGFPISGPNGVQWYTIDKVRCRVEPSIIIQIVEQDTFYSGSPAFWPLHLADWSTLLAARTAPLRLGVLIANTSESAATLLPPDTDWPPDTDNAAIIRRVSGAAGSFSQSDVESLFADLLTTPTTIKPRQWAIDYAGKAANGTTQALRAALDAAAGSIQAANPHLLPHIENYAGNWLQAARNIGHFKLSAPACDDPVGVYAYTLYHDSPSAPGTYTGYRLQSGVFDAAWCINTESQDASGETKAGQWILVDSTWHYRNPPTFGSVTSVAGHTLFFLGAEQADIGTSTRTINTWSCRYVPDGSFDPAGPTQWVLDHGDTDPPTAPSNVTTDLPY